MKVIAWKRKKGTIKKQSKKLNDREEKRKLKETQ